MNRKKLFILLAGVVFIGCDIAILTWFFTRPPRYQEPKLSFDGTSDQLQHTVIVPTLDTPIPEGKNAIWCASFQIAWNKLKTDVTKGPVQIQGAEEIAKRLNDSPVTEADLPEGSWYAAAGLVNDGIVEKIKRDVKEKFAREWNPPELSSPDLTVVAYGNLESSVRFTLPYFSSEEPLSFEGALGTSNVESFGLRLGDLSRYEELRDQIDVLFSDRVGDFNETPATFALDLCKTSAPQLILARIPKKQNLHECVAYVEERGKENKLRKFGVNDSLLVPVMHWRFEHRFRELEGAQRVMLNTPSRGWFIGTAAQSIRFKLDRSGADLGSEFTLGAYKSFPRGFHFQHPFLILLKKRGAAQPFFVMWVDNAELLQKWGE